MIDRKTLRFMMLVILAMCAASFWRLSLASDWAHIPFVGDNGRQHTKNGVILFLGPLSLLLVVALSFLTQRLVSGSEEAITAYQRNNRLVLLGSSVLGILMHAFLISRSLGASLSLSGETLARLVFGITGILIMVQGNNLPKLPWISSRFPSCRLDPWQSVRARRFAGRLSVAYGLTMIAVAALASMRTAPFFVMGLVPIYLGAIIWNSVRLKREPSPLVTENFIAGA